MVSATPQRYKLLICCSIPEPKACLIFKLSKSKSTCRFLKNGYIIKCVIEIKQGMWWAQSPESMGGFTLQSTNDMHPPVHITAEAIGRLVY